MSCFIIIIRTCYLKKTKQNKNKKKEKQEIFRLSPEGGESNSELLPGIVSELRVSKGSGFAKPQHISMS